MFRKLSLFLFIVSFLICTSLSRVTSVSADVTFGSDDDFVVSDDMLDVYRHLALLGSVGDLVSNGVSSFSVSDANSVNNFLDSIFDNLAAGLSDDNPVSNFGVGVWETLDDFNTYLNNKAYDLMSDFDWYWDSGISDVVDFLGGVSSTKVPYKPNLDALKQFKALSKVDGSPQPQPDFSFLSQTKDWLWSGNNQGIYTIGSNPSMSFPGHSNYNTFPIQHEYVSSFIAYHDNSVSALPFEEIEVVPIRGVQSIYITDNGSSVSLSYSNFSYLTYWLYTSNYYYFATYMTQDGVTPDGRLISSNVGTLNRPDFYPQYSFRNDFPSLSLACNYIFRNFRHVNIYYNGNPWVIVDDSSNVINLHLDGTLKLYNDDKPVFYYYPSGTQIDYEALYNVILRAIQNGTPVSQTTINEGNVYYDSHDTVYSPTIYNYYSNSEDEQDFIDDILNLATVPSFDTALVEPLSEPMTNGAAIFGAGVSVFPRDILFLVGAGFVLVLFVALINRLIE